ncbi:hypothetical protein C8R45DRAFT_1016942 [Mycena sanguinolenta]|nr:hypothetical protein C8R45DRAFT_1016942 [Mycena sanguinolenta]
MQQYDFFILASMPTFLFFSPRWCLSTIENDDYQGIWMSWQRIHQPALYSDTHTRRANSDLLDIPLQSDYIGRLKPEKDSDQPIRQDPVSSVLQRFFLRTAAVVDEKDLENVSLEPELIFARN